MARRLTLVPDEQLTPEQLRNRRRSRRARAVRARTFNIRHITKTELELGRMLYPEEATGDRPRCREECVGGQRPCVFVSCKFNLYLDVSPKGSIKFNVPDLEPGEMTESCVLDVTDRGPQTLEDVGKIMNITRERIRQVEARAVGKIAANDDAVSIAIGALTG